MDRVQNEDAYSALVLQLPPHQVFNFSVFDGHGSKFVLQYLASHLASSVESFPKEKLSLDYLDQLVARYRAFYESRPPQTPPTYWNKWQRGLTRTFNRLASESMADDDLQMRLFFAYLELDLYMAQHPKELDPGLPTTEYPPGGSTATSVYIYTMFSAKKGSLYFDDNTVSKLVVLHLGDTRGILVDKFGTAHPLTSNHHPDLPVENTRLMRLTDFSVNTDSFGEERFLNYANTRAFGDCVAKTRGVTAEPDTLAWIIGGAAYILKNMPQLRDHTIGKIGGDESFLVLCTDGVTSVCTDQEIADLVMSSYNLKSLNPQSCAEEVVKYVETLGGDDNATCMVIRLNGWGKWPIVDRTGSMREEKLSGAVFGNRRRGTG